MIRTFLTNIFVFIVWFSAIADSEKIAALEKKLVKATDTAKVNTLNELSSLYASSNLNYADSLAKVAKGLLESIDFPRGEINNLNHLSYINSSLGQYEEALEYSQSAIELSESLRDQHLLAQSYDHEFMVYFQKGDNSNGKISAENCNRIARENGDTRLIAKSYDNLGILKGMKGEHSQAIEYFMKSLTAFEELGDKSKISLALMHIGHTFELAGSYEKALEYLKRSLEINKEVGNKYNEGWTLVNIGVVYSRINQVDAALTYYEKSLQIAEEINNHRLILTCLDNIGGKYSLKKDFEKSNSFLQRAYHLSEESGQNSRTVYITGNLAENYLYMGKFDSARIFGEQQLELALASELISEQKVAYYILAQIYDSLGDYSKAHRALLEYIAVNDTIFSRQKSEQIEALRESYETEKKEQEIENLTALNESARYRNMSYAGAAVSFLILGGLLYYVQRLRIRRNRHLLEKEKELDRMKSRFFANISHEFRTPLTLILSPLDGLITKIDQVDIKKQLKVMKRNASRLLDLVNQLLDLSKLESGKLKLNVSNSDIIAVIKGVSMSFQSIAEQKSIEIKLDVAPKQLHVNYDRPKIETVLTNLLSNAFKFAPEDSTITIQVFNTSTNSGLQQKEFVHISVSDSGPGISKEDAGQIFDRFYQSVNNQLMQQEGSGIGLALTKELVELHGGSISVSSELGKGTKVTVKLPLDILRSEALLEENFQGENTIKIHDTEVAEEFNDEVMVNQLPVVLVVEDNVDVRNYIREILEEGYSVQTAENGEIGIIKAFEIIPDLIISDVMMPMKDGFEVCTELKNDEKTSHIPIILLTARSDSEDKIEGLMTAADDYITKPFVPKELLARIQNLIDSRKRLIAKYRSDGVLKPKDIATNSIDEKFLGRIIELVELYIGDEKLGVEQLSNEIGMSRSQLHRKMTALVNQGPNQFIRSFRLQRAHDLLAQQSATASEIAYQVGFNSPSYFTKCFHEQFGYTPSEVPVSS